MYGFDGRFHRMSTHRNHTSAHQGWTIAPREHGAMGRKVGPSVFCYSQIVPCAARCEVCEDLFLCPLVTCCTCLGCSFRHFFRGRDRRWSLTTPTLALAPISSPSRILPCAPSLTLLGTTTTTTCSGTGTGTGTWCRKKTRSGTLLFQSLLLSLVLLVSSQPGYF